MTTARNENANPEDVSLTADVAFGRTVYMTMFDKHVNQTKVAAALNIDQSTLSRKLRGERPWRLEEIIAVADALRVDLRDLLSHMWGDSGPGAAGSLDKSGQWAPWDSNPQPTDYEADVSNGSNVIPLRARRAS